MIPPRRYPRKYKKQHFTKIDMEWSEEERAKIFEAAKQAGMRPTRFIHWSLMKAIEEWPNQKN